MSYIDDTDWALMDFEEKPQAPVASTPVLKGHCPKCGRKLGKGGHFHVVKCDPSKAE